MMFVDGLKDALCDFGQPAVCSYLVNCTGCRQESPSYKWRRTSGPAPSLHTGPRGDSGRDSDPGGTEGGGGYISVILYWGRVISQLPFTDHEGSYLSDPVLKRAYLSYFVLRRDLYQWSCTGGGGVRSSNQHLQLVRLKRIESCLYAHFFVYLEISSSSFVRYIRPRWVDLKRLIEMT